MRIDIHAVGRMKAGAERDLARHYLDRFAKSGSALALEFGSVNELSESRQRSAEARCREESEQIAQALPQGSVLAVLDERGKTPGSREFAERLGRYRDDGVRAVSFVIGGPDGHDAAFRERADWVLSLGRMTWPHQIARILLAEQLYRAVTILSGHPYHRD